MDPPDPLNTSTLDAPGDKAARAPVPTARVVFRAASGIVAEPARRLRSGVTLAGRGAGPRGIDVGEDALASREHAAVIWRPEQAELRIEDRGSRNGTRVNGHRVERAALADGDVVGVGSSFFVVRFEDPRQIDVPSPMLVGPSPALQAVRVAVARVARNDATVLIAGETGTGKEVVAAAIHAASGRRGAFVAVNCAAITESLAESQLFGHVEGAFTGARHDHVGFFRAAEGGTLFLDEVGDTPPALQSKLLRALESRTVVPVGAVAPKPFQARVVAATNVHMADAVQRGAFRGDLYARLAQLRIEIPPLRLRREDILPLVAQRLGPATPPLEPELVEALLVHPWPYNVRELFAVITEVEVLGAGAARLELALVQDGLAAAGAAPAAATTVPEASSRRRDEAEPPPSAASLDALLAKHAGNVAAVAREVGRSRTQVYRWITQLGIDAARHRAPT